MKGSKREVEKQKADRLGEEKLNHQGCLMKIISYNKVSDIVVEFQDKYKTKVHTEYGNFLSGGVKNPYCPSVFEIGVIGTKYPLKVDGKQTKEYQVWKAMLQRCYDEKYKKRYSTYKSIICCNEWLLFENFYEWLHEQENFDKWIVSERWAIDKDILIKRNKLYSPETCCLVPQSVNTIFTKHNLDRGNLPIGVTKHGKVFQTRCQNPILNKSICLGNYSTINEAFQAYKAYKEDIIKQVAEIEYQNGNITKQCYEAMMNYIVEIDD